MVENTEERKGDWFVTYSGKRFYAFDARVEDINIKDIAHSLSLQTRWNGHCKTFYSIASHSLACARVAERIPATADVVAWALMHDAAEAYIGDIIRPIKKALLVDFGNQAFTMKEVEERLLRIIAEKFNLPWPIPETVFEIDNRMLVMEAMYLTNYGKPDHWVTERPWADIKPYAGAHVLLYQEPRAAEDVFLARAREYLKLA